LSEHPIGWGIVLFAYVLYLLLGLAMLKERMISSVAQITAPTAKKTSSMPDWTPNKVFTSLLALTSAAPLLFLMAFDALRTGPESRLGPITIIGSASFNLIAIPAVSLLTASSLKYIEGLF
jgi:hypothetical protein